MNVAEKIKPSTDLVIVETLNAAVVFAPGGVDAILEKIRAEVASIKTDISTATGRDQIRSLAFKIARSKTALDEMGKDLVANLKKQTGSIDAERRRIRDELDALRDRVRQPLTDYENAEKARIEAHEAALAAIVESGGYGQTETAAEIQARLEFLLSYPACDWQEFAARAADTIQAEISRTRGLLAGAEMREAERAELERLRREQAEREQRERDERIAAAAAERARIEAEAKAMQEAEEAAARAEAERARIEQEKVAAEARAKDAIARAEKAERDRIAAEKKAEADKKAGAEKAARDRVAAVEAERKRVADNKARADAEAAKREDNKKHRAKVENEILAALCKAGLDEVDAALAIAAIAQGKVPHTKINY